MIFQLGIDLDIKEKFVQAIVDLDTGMIGFSEKVNEETIEYNYYNCPPEYRLAFIIKIEGLASDKKLLNWEICRKAEAFKLLGRHWKNNNEN